MIENWTIVSPKIMNNFKCKNKNFEMLFGAHLAQFLRNAPDKVTFPDPVLDYDEISGILRSWYVDHFWLEKYMF